MTERKVSEFKIIMDPEYVALGDSFIKMINGVKEGMEIGLKREVITKAAEEQINTINQGLKSFQSERKKQYEGRLNAMRFEKATTEIKEPALLLLERQDIELKFKTMSEADLADYATNLFSFMPDLFTVQQLQIASSNIGSEELKALVSLKTDEYKAETNVGEGYKNSNEYLETENLLNEVNILGNALYIQRSRHPKELALSEFNVSAIDSLDKDIKMVFDMSEELFKALHGYN
ncbi:hypothetical protein P7H60_11350 [Vagococcus carniphilus]|uniref:hypothetical protein n=1 Tax=Vagococcus carniphilus TaxID=218144 RepID=UPI00289092CA|nr:hypothetical protein [Vagococcus carniphilus]MDT2849737.1 hypothetical protein [Vagococcus carniphilus]